LSEWCWIEIVTAGALTRSCVGVDAAALLPDALLWQLLENAGAAPAAGSWERPLSMVADCC
jgi:hypothetical protein